jgi:hypothetical protein
LAGLVHGSPVVPVVAIHVAAGIVLFFWFFLFLCTPFDPKWPNESVFHGRVLSCMEKGLLFR